MEAYYLLCYLVHEPPDSVVREFRQTLWEYHEGVERHAMLRISLLIGSCPLGDFRRSEESQAVHERRGRASPNEGEANGPA